MNLIESSLVVYSRRDLFPNLLADVDFPDTFSECHSISNRIVAHHNIQVFSMQIDRELPGQN